MNVENISAENDMPPPARGCLRKEAGRRSTQAEGYILFRISSGVMLSIKVKPNHFFPRSFIEAPMR